MEKKWSRKMPIPKLKTFMLLLLVTLLVSAPHHARAFFWDKDDTLLEINGDTFTAEDFKNWWQVWQEPQMPVPEKPDEFLDWVLLAKEAEQMQMYENPSFQRKVSIFLKVQTLMMLRQEEVTDRIAPPSEADLKKIYHREYSPFYNLRMIALGSAEEMALARQRVAEGILLQAVAEQTGFNDPSRYIEETGEMRPVKIPSHLKPVVLSLQPGQVGGPVSLKEVSYLIEVLSAREGTEDDFRSLQELLERKYRKSEDRRLTQELIQTLKVKYAVEVDRTFIEALDEQGISEGDAARVVLRIGDIELTAGRLFQETEKHLKLRGSSSMGSANFANARDSVIAGIITQTLLGMESLARHYEQRQPFKSTYEFYRRNRLIKELEKEVFWPQVTVSKEDVKKEYDAHPERYSHTVNQVELYQVTTKSEKLAETLGARLKAGEDFGMVMKTLDPGGLSAEKKPPGDLLPEVRAALATLSPGQAAGPIAGKGKVHFIKLLGYVHSVLLPLENVAASIQDQLRKERFAEVRNDYLQRLKQKITIKINERTWETTRQQLLEKADAHN